MTENGIRCALQNDDSALVYQPKVEPQSGRMVGMKALIRWLTPGGTGIVRPDEFIPVAEAPAWSCRCGTGCCGPPAGIGWLGMSNLRQLKRLPIDIVKIDKSFIQDVLIDKEDAEIANAIIRLAHCLTRAWWRRAWKTRKSPPSSRKWAATKSRASWSASRCRPMRSRNCLRKPLPSAG